MIIHAGKIEKNVLKNLVISVYDDEFRNQKNIIANEANITKKNLDNKNAIDLMITLEEKN